MARLDRFCPCGVLLCDGEGPRCVACAIDWPAASAAWWGKQQLALVGVR